MKSRLVYVLAALLVVVGVSYAGWKVVHERERHTCAACQRPVHEQSRTVAAVNGKKLGYCCLACALSERRQTGASVKVVSLTDYAGGSEIQPESAYVVRGSNMHSCSHRAAAVGSDKRLIEMHFDRCSPSLIAFSSKAAAQAFAREHGGQALPYAQVTSLAESRRP